MSDKQDSFDQIDEAFFSQGEMPTEDQKMLEEFHQLDDSVDVIGNAFRKQSRDKGTLEERVSKFEITSKIIICQKLNCVDLWAFLREKNNDEILSLLKSEGLSIEDKQQLATLLYEIASNARRIFDLEQSYSASTKSLKIIKAELLKRNIPLARPVKDPWTFPDRLSSSVYTEEEPCQFLPVVGEEQTPLDQPVAPVRDTAPGDTYSKEFAQEAGRLSTLDHEVGPSGDLGIKQLSQRQFRYIQSLLTQEAKSKTDKSRLFSLASILKKAVEKVGKKQNNIQAKINAAEKDVLSLKEKIKIFSKDDSRVAVGQINAIINALAKLQLELDQLMIVELNLEQIQARVCLRLKESLDERELSIRKKEENLQNIIDEKLRQLTVSLEENEALLRRVVEKNNELRDSLDASQKSLAIKGQELDALHDQIAHCKGDKKLLNDLRIDYAGLTAERDRIKLELDETLHQLYELELTNNVLKSDMLQLRSDCEKEKSAMADAHAQELALHEETLAMHEAELKEAEKGLKTAKLAHEQAVQADQDQLCDEFAKITAQRDDLRQWSLKLNEVRPPSGLIWVGIAAMFILVVIGFVAII